MISMSIIDWLGWIFGKPNEHLLSQINKLNSQIEFKNQVIKVLQKQAKWDNLKIQNMQKELNDLNEKLQNIINNQENISPNNISKPAEINSAHAYTGAFIKLNKNGSITTTYNPPFWWYFQSDLLETVYLLRYSDLTFKEKLHRIWGIVITQISYSYDYKEDWRSPTQTLLLKQGDCEDTTILFVWLCWLAGLPADKIFVGVGTIFDYGHAFPMVKINDEYYVYETTLTGIPAEPKKYIGSNYHASWGMLNWKFQGKIKNDGSALAIQTYGGSGSMKKKKIKFKLTKKQNKKKLKKIRDEWK